MGVGIYLEGSYGKPGFLRRPPDPETWLDEIKVWIEQREGDQLLHAEIKRPEPRGPLTLYAGLHPANEDLEVQCPKPGRVHASIKTSGAGPGLHQHVSRLLHEMEERFEIRWDPPNERKGTGDPSGYFTSGDRTALEREMLNWLHNVAGQVLDMQEQGYEAIGISMPMDGVTFTCPGALYTSTGPRDLHWLRRAATDFLSGIDLFPWWDEARDARYYRERALVHMWTEVKWRPAFTEEELATHRRVLSLLDRAAELDPTLPLPSVEREEIRSYLERVEPSALGGIGYYRGKVTRHLAGDWSIELPGSMVEEVDDEGNWSAWDETRTVQFGSLSIGNRQSRPSAEELNEDGRKDFEGPDTMEVDEPDLKGIACFMESTEPNTRPYLLSGRTAVDGGLAISTIEFDDVSQRAWAEATWRSIRHSGDEDEDVE